MMTLRKTLAGFTAIALAAGLAFVQPAMAQGNEKSPNGNTKTVQKEAMVFFNTHSHKYHKPSCEWAQRCTRNCIMIPKSQAVHQGGMPCRVCGG